MEQHDFSFSDFMLARIDNAWIKIKGLVSKLLPHLVMEEVGPGGRGRVGGQELYRAEDGLKDRVEPIFPDVKYFEKRSTSHNYVGADQRSKAPSCSASPIVYRVWENCSMYPILSL